MRTGLAQEPGLRAGGGEGAGGLGGGVTTTRSDSVGANWDVEKGETANLAGGGGGGGGQGWRAVGGLQRARRLLCARQGPLKQHEHNTASGPACGGHSSQLPPAAARRSPVVGASCQLCGRVGEGAVRPAAAVVVLAAARAGKRRGWAGTGGSSGAGRARKGPASRCRSQCRPPHPCAAGRPACLPARLQARVPAAAPGAAHPAQAQSAAVAGLGAVDDSTVTSESPLAASVSQEEATKEPPATRASA